MSSSKSDVTKMVLCVSWDWKPNETTRDTKTDPRAALIESLRNLGLELQGDSLGESIAFLLGMLVEMEAEQLTDAKKHERTPQ